MWGGGGRGACGCLGVYWKRESLQILDLQRLASLRMMAKSLFTRMCYVHVVIVLVILPLSVVIEFTCCVMCLRNFIGIKLLVCLLAFSVILVMFIFLAFLDTICKVMFVLLCMRKQKNGCVLLAEGSLWEAVLPILLTWYCYIINRDKLY